MSEIVLVTIMTSGIFFAVALLLELFYGGDE